MLGGGQECCYFLKVLKILKVLQSMGTQLQEPAFGSCHRCRPADICCYFLKVPYILNCVGDDGQEMLLFSKSSKDSKRYAIYEHAITHSTANLRAAPRDSVVAPKLLESLELLENNSIPALLPATIFGMFGTFRK